MREPWCGVLRLVAHALVAVPLVSPLAFAADHTGSPSAAPVYDYRVVASYPHDPQAYTQGLLFHDGRLYESTGRDSDLRELRLESGKIVQKVALDDEYFGEGLARWGDRLIQLTWKAGTGFVYDLDNLRRLRQFSYVGEGWGLTQDGTHLIMSDGTPTLRFLDPDSFELHRRIRVMDGDMPVDALNELEYVRGEIYANVYRSDRIARIDPRSGRVKAWIDLSGLVDQHAGAGVLNGIAYDADAERLFVTGKYWPRLFEIEPRP